ncbi:transcriptional regulator [Arabidopsis thaliana]|uniref:Transcriptional regulator n=1 Tax=Arabidopsis thaliana TaxID=3702 RepID=F4JTF2_ARATH|nr:transcriptional regulator [Arabidopsis thaliana]AEE85973.1 transcriptional regulator [Arabidopsis thaliana]|eukprot:NP_001190882.1 transcriptional regulator [Arabidopsis thaliana]
MSDSDKELENQIIEAGEKLIDPPSSLDELLSFLDKLFVSLAEVEQSPPDSMQNALTPLMKGLVGGKLFKHSDVDVKVAVAACISEITRITAPDAPYDDDQMKEVFKLIVSSFEDLVDKSSRSYAKRISILETVAKVRSCVVMLDLECDALLIEMFQHFLKAIRDHHSGNVFSSMENIMTLVLEESEDIPSEMLSPILHSVKKDDEISQVSRRLAEQVLSNCASKLKTYLTEAVKSSGVPLDKYSNIVASICEGTFSALQQDQVVANEKEDSQGHIKRETEVEAAEISTPERTDAPKDESGKSGVSNGVAQQNDSSVDTDSMKKQDDTGAKDEPQQLDNPRNTDLNNTTEEKPDVEHQIEEKENESSSVKQADLSKDSDIKEETEPAELLDSKDVLTSPPVDSSVTAATSSENEKNKSVQILPSKTSGDETANVSSPSMAEELPEQSVPKKTANQKKKESSTEEVKPSASIATEEVSEEPNTSEPQVTKKSGKKVASSSKTKPTVPPSKKSTSETKVAKQSEKKVVGSDNAQESTKPKEEKKKPGRGKAIDEESLHTSSGDNEKPAVSSGKLASKSKKEAKQTVEESPNSNTKRKRSLGQGKASGESLVGSRIKVWWPMDQAYYKGVVESYDAAKKKHLVIYDDGDQEILYLKNQKWSPLDESELSQDEEAADQTGQEEDASTVPLTKKAKTGKQSKMDNSSAKKGSGAGSSKAKATPASKSSKTSQDDKTASKSKDSKEASREEEASSEEESEEEEPPKTVGKSGSSRSKKDISSVSKSGKSKASSKKKEEPSKATTSSKSKSGPVKSVPAKSKTGKGKAKSGSASTPASKAKESASESESEETPKEPEPATKAKSGKSQGSQSKSGKKRKR